MTPVSPDISWAFDDGQKINVKFAIEPTAEYHAYKFDNWEWKLLPGQSREDINADGWVTIVVNSDIQEAVKGAEGKGFRIHGYGLYVEKVTKGDTPDTDVADDILWEGHHYLNWNAFNDLCANKEWGNSNRYMLTFDKTLTAGTYEYKMIVNHKWGVYELPLQTSTKTNWFSKQRSMFLLVHPVSLPSPQSTLSTSMVRKSRLTVQRLMEITKWC